MQNLDNICIWELPIHYEQNQCAERSDCNPCLTNLFHKRVFNERIRTTTQYGAIISQHWNKSLLATTVDQT